MNEAQALQINSALTVVIIPAMVLFAWIGDTIIRRTRLIGIAMTVLALLCWPLHTLMLKGSLTVVIISQLVLFLCLSVPLGSAPAVFVELFPSSDRLTGYSISFNLGIGVLGGATPALATWAIAATEYTLSPAIMCLLSATLAAVAVIWMSDRSREPLR